MRRAWLHGSGAVLLAALAGSASGQKEVTLPWLSFERSQLSYSPSVLTIPVADLLDPAALAGFPTRPVASSTTWSVRRFCMLGGKAGVDAELLRAGSGPPALRLWLPPMMDSEVRYLLSIVLHAEQALPAFRASHEQGFREIDSCIRVDVEDKAQRVAMPVLRQCLVPYDPTRREETYKAFDALYSFGGHQLLTKGAGGDYPHHRGVFLGWNKARVGDRVLDWWHCKEPATVRHDRIETEHEWLGKSHAMLVRRLRWCDGEETVLTERRRITAWSPWISLLQGSFLDYEIELLAFQPIELDGDPHHGGFQIRVAQEVHDNPDATEFLRPEDARSEGNDVWRGGRWCAIRFPLAGETQQIAMLDHPQNGDPPQWSTRAYGRFGAFRRHTLQPGIPLVLRYRLIVASDSAYTRFTPQFLDARWREWIEPPVPKILR